MKLLGYVFGQSGAAEQVSHILTKFRKRLWSLNHLRRSGSAGVKLFKLYTIWVRPIIKTNCVIFHSMLTKTQSLQLERFQKMLTRICFGHHLNYHQIHATYNISTLETRRINTINKFALKSISNLRFAQKWFWLKEEIAPELRNRRPFIENKCWTQCYHDSPLFNLQRVANDLMTAAQPPGQA